MGSVQFKVPAGTDLDSPLVESAMRHAARFSAAKLGKPYFINNDDGESALNVCADILDGDRV